MAQQRVSIASWPNSNKDEEPFGSLDCILDACARAPCAWNLPNLSDRRYLLGQPLHRVVRARRETDLCRISKLSRFVQRPDFLEVHLGYDQIEYSRQSAPSLPGAASGRYGEPEVQGHRVLSITLLRSDWSFTSNCLHRLADHAGPK